MEKVISCGVLVKYQNRYILGHASGQNHFDIFKGRMDKGENYTQTAIRECQEESGLIFNEDQLKMLGFFDYTKTKNIVIFITKVDDFDMSRLKCTTFLESGKPEMDFYATMDFDEMISKVGKSMGRLLKTLEPEIKAI
jgi:predicted NUDIX family NTP pyrophosphohydrolase